MNKQRSIIYTFRGEIVRSANTRDQIYDIVYDVVSGRVEEMLQGGKEDTLEAFLIWVHSTFPISVKREELGTHREDVEKTSELIFEKIKQAYELKMSLESGDVARAVERHVMLQAIDLHWQDYLRSMDGLRQGVGLRAYGQRDPLIEYKREAYDMFANLMDDIREEICSKMFRASGSILTFERFMNQLPRQMIHDEVATLGQGTAPAAPARPTVRGGNEVMQAVLKASSAPPVQRQADRVGRNDACPCGSGKKYKKCCGANA
jgi:preprotein translocase subunit SecA